MIRLPYPHRGQQIVRSQAQRFNWLSAGRRWRKTSGIMSVAVENSLSGKQIIWGAPTYQQTRIAFDETRRAAVGYADFNISRLEVRFPGRGVIRFRSLDNPDNARGYTADGVIIDECGDVIPEAWYEVLRPMLIDTGGFLWAIGTPKGRNWFFQEHRAAQSRVDSQSWQAPTVGCEIVNSELIRKPHPLENPSIPFAEIHNLWQTMPERTFRQEVLAEFVEGQGAVFRNISNATKAPYTTPDAHQGHRIIVGADWAKQHDYTAFSVGCATCKRELARDRFNQIDYVLQMSRLLGLAEQWKPSAILTELNSIGQPIFEQLQRAGLPVIGFDTTATSKPPLIENLALAVERAEWLFQDDPIWTGELEAYERKVSAITGRSQYGAPARVNDDTVMARALMVWQATRPAAEDLVDFL